MLRFHAHWICALSNAEPALMVRKAFVLLAVSLAACAGVPQKEFEVYRSNFNTAKATAEDIILQAKLDAEQTAKLPANKDPVAERDRKLAERTAALDARLAALNLIAQYNAVLVALADGDDPAAVQSNLQNLSKGLSSFGSSKLTALVANAGPLAGMISQAVTIVDALIKQKKFRDATIQAQPAILGILHVLQEDADRIHAIQVQLVELRRDSDWNKVISLKKRLAKMANGYAKSSELDGVAGQYDKQIARIQPPPSEPTLFDLDYAPSGNTKATDAEIEVMKGMVDEVTRHVDSYNAFGDEIEAHGKAISQYKALLDSVTLSFNAMSAAESSPQFEAVTQQVVKQGLALRQAVLGYQEARHK